MAWSRPGSAVSRPGRGPGSRGPGRPGQPCRNGGELSSAAPGRQCQRPRSAPGGRPIGGAPPLGALSRPLSGGREEPPREAPLAPPQCLLWGSDPLGPAKPGAGARPKNRGRQPGARPAHRPGASPRGARAGTPKTQGDPAEPVRAPRNSPGPGGPLGIIPSRAGRRLPGSGADARAPAPSAERSRLSERNAGLQPPERRAGQGARAGLPER